jgi:hypothetical protein
MRKLTNSRNVAAIIAVIAALSLSAPHAQAQRYSAWSAPQNITPLNTTASEVCPFIAPDGLSMYLASDRAGGSGGFDLMVSTRSNPNSVWGMPVNLGTNLNSTGGELCPTVTPGGFSVYFISNKPGGCGGNDIYVAHRQDPQGAWGPVFNLGCQVNSAQSEMSPSLYTDPAGTTFLYFSSNRPGGPGMTDIYVSTLQSNGSFGPPSLVPDLNTAFNDQRPNINVREGLELFFESDRTGAVGSSDLYVATRENPSSPWRTPVNLRATVNSASAESRPSLSFDGRELYFHSDRPGGAGAADIYVVRRNIFTALDTDRDFRTDLRAYRPGNGTFYILNSATGSYSNYSFGAPVAGLFTGGVQDDYDGDGKSDIMAFTSTSGGVRTWGIIQSATGTTRTVQWGLTSDQALPADYDGDGKTDVAVFRASEGVWYILLSSTGQMRADYWGTAGDIPSAGDYDGDGINDLTVIRPSTTGGAATWYTRRSTDGVMIVDYWGGGVAGASDNPFFGIQVDVDSDGIRDRMVVRDPDSTTTGSQTTYFIQRSSDRAMLTLVWGLDTDGRAFGDYDADGKTDFVARRNMGGQLVWYILLSSKNYDPAQSRIEYWGTTGDV